MASSGAQPSVIWSKVERRTQFPCCSITRVSVPAGSSILSSDPLIGWFCRIVFGFVTIEVLVPLSDMIRAAKVIDAPNVMTREMTAKVPINFRMLVFDKIR